MLYIKKNALGEAELHGDTAEEILNAFYGTPIPVTPKEGVIQKNDIVKNAGKTGQDSPEEIERRKAARARFFPDPGTSHGDRCEKALTRLGILSKTSDVLKAVLEDGDFEPKGDKLDAVRNAMTNKSKVFSKHPGKLWGLVAWDKKEKDSAKLELTNSA